MKFFALFGIYPRLPVSCATKLYWRICLTRILDISGLYPLWWWLMCFPDQLLEGVKIANWWAQKGPDSFSCTRQWSICPQANAAPSIQFMSEPFHRIWAVQRSNRVCVGCLCILSNLICACPASSFLQSREDSPEPVAEGIYPMFDLWWKQAQVCQKIYFHP